MKFFLFADYANIYFESKDLKNLEESMNFKLKKNTKFIYHAPNKPKFPITHLDQQ